VVAFSKKALFRSNFAKKPGLLGLIFRKAQNKVQDPAKLRRLIADLIDKEEWPFRDALLSVLSLDDVWWRRSSSAYRLVLFAGLKQTELAQ
jgi:hypothetical protein